MSKGREPSAQHLTSAILLALLFPGVVGLSFSSTPVAAGRVPTARVPTSGRMPTSGRVPSIRSSVALVALPLESTRPEQPPLEVLYDSLCMVCLTNKALLTFFDRRKTRLEFVDIRSKGYDGDAHGGISFEDAMRHFHVIDSHGEVHEGSDAVLTAYSAVGLGWMMALFRLPLIRTVIDFSYKIVSRHRHVISRYLPGGAALATAVTSLNDVSSASQGFGCEDEEECMLDYDDDDDEEK
jgi:predicted DCC family thiol-disulfide oxidoreductase YuxK